MSVPANPSDSGQPLPPVDPYAETDDDQADEILQQCLEAYAEVAPLNDPAALLQFLPDAAPQTVRFVLIELIKLDMAIAAETGPIPRIESYLGVLPTQLSRDTVPIDLVMEELQLRRESGEDVDASSAEGDFKQRFPQFGTVAGELLGVPSEATAAVTNLGAPPELELGRQVDDFLIIQLLGSGAFAHVYLARQVSMQRLVALKVSRGTGDEPKALSKLDHVNIVRVYDQRELTDPEVHLLYMPFHPGGTLSDVVKLVRPCDAKLRDGDLLLRAVDLSLLTSAQAVPERSSVRKFVQSSEWPTVVAWVGIQLARALDDAHSHGVLHRDVKPANVLLSAEGIPKLADFNVSFSGAAGRAGASSSFGGSIGYMAPEHLRAINASILDAPEDVAESADLYSLAVLLWELWQGRRPFDVPRAADSWTQAVADQQDARTKPLTDPVRTGTASERVLEATLRYTLQAAPESRPASGAELAGRLKLALHPEAASIFDPDPSTRRAKWLSWSPWIIPAVVLLVPNVFVMWFNFAYNNEALLKPHQQDIPDLKGYFEALAMTVSAVCLGIGVVFLVLHVKRFVAAVSSAQSGQSANESSIDAVIGLGKVAAIIGGALWAIAGLVYPVALSLRFPELPLAECVRFFFSLVICGGVAAIYPYFGMTTLATLIYYPRLIKNSMQDANYDRRSSQIIQQAERFWLAAVAIPLVGAALLVFSDAAEKSVVLSAVAATGIGAFLALRAYTTIQTYWKQKMATVLSLRDASVTPGLGVDE